jgi:hypothetical protein
MVSFRSPEEQARHAVRKNLQLGKARHTNRDDKKIHSVGTMRIHEQALTRVAEWIRENRLGDLTIVLRVSRSISAIVSLKCTRLAQHAIATSWRPAPSSLRSNSHKRLRSLLLCK